MILYSYLFKLQNQKKFQNRKVTFENRVKKIRKQKEPNKANGMKQESSKLRQSARRQ